MKRLHEAGAVMLGQDQHGRVRDGFVDGALGVLSDVESVGSGAGAGGVIGGSAAAVAAGEAVVSLGSDTGGSIRQPGAFCGLVGMKPTYGRVSRYGLIAFASSLDQIGPFSRTVEDSATLLQAVAGWDMCDSTSVDVPVPDFAGDLDKGLEGLRVAAPQELFVGADPAVLEATEAAIAQLERLGATIDRDQSLPSAAHALAVYTCSRRLRRRRTWRATTG